MCSPDVTNIEIEIAQDCFNQHIGPSDRRRSSRGVPFRDSASQCMLKPTWRSQQKREEQAEAEAATAMAAEEPDFDTGQAEAYEEQGSDVGDEDIDRAQVENDSAIAEPESEPDSEHPKEANPQRKEGADDNGSDGDSADDGALPAEEDALPVLPQVSRPTLDEYRAKWARLLAQHAKPVAGGYSIGNLVPTPIHQLWQDCPYVPFDELKSEEAQSRLSVCKPISGLTESTRAGGGVERYAHNSGEVPHRLINQSRCVYIH